MAVPTVVSVGAANAGATTAVTPAFPTGMQVGDIIVGIGESAGAEVYPTANTNGFAHVTGSPANQDPQTVLTVVWARYDGVMTAHSWGDSGNHNMARYIAIRGVKDTDPPWNATPQSAVESVADTSAAWPAVTTTVADCLVLFCIATGRDLATTANLGAMSGGTGLTNFAEQMDNWTASGTGGGFGLVTASKVAAGSTGSPTATLANADTKAFITLALEPAPPPPPGAAPPWPHPSRRTMHLRRR
jgi:hypothetical protein